MGEELGRDKEFDEVKMKTQLAIIGASYLQLPLVMKAKEMGIKTHCFAWEQGAVCRDVCDHFYPISILEKEAILAKCREIRIDGITTIASDTATVAVNYVAAQMNLVANPDQYTAICTNKYEMRKCFAKCGVPSPKFAPVGRDGKWDADGFSYPLIVKPTDRSGSRGVEKVDIPGNLSAAVQRAVRESFSGGAIIEEYVDGREVSVESISYDGKHYVLQITDKVTTGAPFFVELEHHQPSALPAEIKQRIFELVPKALDALHILHGASHSELKITPDGDIRFIEIGARMGGDFIGSHLVRLSTGYDFLRGVIEVALGDFCEPKITLHKHSGVYFLCEQTEWLKTVIENRKQYPEIVDAEITDLILRPVECSGDRSGYAIYQGEEKMKLKKL